MNCEFGDPDCDPGYDQDYLNFERTPDIDASSSSTNPPEIPETLFQKVYTVCGAVLVGGIILLFLMLLLAIPTAGLIGIAIVSWKIVQFTHYLILIPLIMVGTWFFMTLKFVMSDSHPRISKF